MGPFTQLFTVVTAHVLVLANATATIGTLPFLGGKPTARSVRRSPSKSPVATNRHPSPPCARLKRTSSFRLLVTSGRRYAEKRWVRTRASAGGIFARHVSATVSASTRPA